MTAGLRSVVGTVPLIYRLNSLPCARPCPGAAHPEEDPAVPARAGDGARDGGQRLVGPPLPFEAVGGDGDDLLDALPLAQQPRADDRQALLRRRFRSLAPIAASSSSPSRSNRSDRLRFQPAIGEFLDAIGQPAFQIASVERRRLAVKQIAPLLASGRASSVLFSAARRAGIGSVMQLSVVSVLHDHSGRAGSVGNFLQ